jgi:hypothetical protein
MIVEYDEPNNLVTLAHPEAPLGNNNLIELEQGTSNITLEFTTLKDLRVVNKS